MEFITLFSLVVVCVFIHHCLQVLGWQNLLMFLKEVPYSHQGFYLIYLGKNLEFFKVIFMVFVCLYWDKTEES